MSPNSSAQSALANNLSSLQGKYEQLKSAFKQKNKEAADWLEESFVNQADLANFARQFITATAFVTQMALSQPVEAQVQQNLSILEQKQRNKLLSQVTLQEIEEIISKMIGYSNMVAGHLPKEDELYLEQQLSDLLGFEVLAELDGHRLNHSIGIMGGEQHLMRYPGDSLEDHDAYREAGLAPNRGAFGWFTDNGELTQKAIQMEKYYFAVQTMYLSNWNSNHNELKPWYKFKKMIVINPAEELAVVGVVADAGPAMWVKKQFGGSPEVIREGKIWSSKTRGKVILFFVNDPQDEIPLGVIDFKQVINELGEK